MHTYQQHTPSHTTAHSSVTVSVVVRFTIFLKFGIPQRSSFIEAAMFHWCSSTAQKVHVRLEPGVMIQHTQQWVYASITAKWTQMNHPTLEREPVREVTALVGEMATRQLSNRCTPRSRRDEPPMHHRTDEHRARTQSSTGNGWEQHSNALIRTSATDWVVTVH